MGVHGLWKLIDPAGKPVPLETLENKVLAVDVSIWLHQLVKGFQDSTGGSLPNAHLLGLYHRICKLLFFKIKPVFVFDGGVPVLKRRTMVARQNQKNKAEQASEKMREQLLRNLLKQNAVSQVLEEIRNEKKISPKKPDMFELPPVIENESQDSEPEETSSCSEEIVKKLRYKDLHSINVNSQEFKDLPVDIRHDILTELKETRKQSSWGRLHEMPEDSSDFSSYQMKRLLTRRSVQVSLEEAEQEMGGQTLSLGDVEIMLKEGGVDVSSDIGLRIASDSNTRYLYINSQDGNNISTNEAALPSSATKISTDHTNSSDSEIDGKQLNTLEEVYMDSDDSSDCLHKNIGRARQVIENSDISQEQILALIKVEKQNMKFGLLNLNTPSTSKQGQEYEDLLFRDETVEELKETKAQIDGKETSENIEQTIIFSPKLKPLISSLNLKDTAKISKKLFQDELIEEVKNEEESNLSKDIEKNPSDTTKSLSLKTNMIKDETANKIKPKSNVLSKVRADILKTLNNQLKELSNPVCHIELNTNVDLNIVEADPERLTTITNKVSSEPNNDPVIKDQDVSLESNVEREEAEILSSSESDGDFINVPSPILSNHIIGQKSLPCIQVQIQTDDVCKDDIFADVFAEENYIQEGTVNKNNIKAGDQERLEITNNIIAHLETADNRIKNSVELLDKDLVPSVVENENCIQEGTVNKNNIQAGDQKRLEITSNIIAHLETADKRIENSVELLDKDLVPSVVENENFIANVLNQNETKLEETVICDQRSENNNESVESLSSAINQQQEDIVSKPKLTSKELVKLKNFLENQEEEILLERGKEERVATTITEQMYVEAQELLQLFGLPYVVAPMEAEAQCAFLDSIGLTQGTITDDSDIWLFGGRKVYKNFFNQQKYVMQFQSNDIQQFFNLARVQLVLLALLVGSDYTVGLQGVGPVTALEILASFPPPSKADGTDIALLISSLEKFKQWLASCPATSLGKKLKDVQLQPGFPSSEVVKAYLYPEVDESTETFSWGTPDLDALREFALRKFGWNKSRSDSVLLPVMKKLFEKSSQKTLDNYFQSMPNIPAHQGRMSVRVQRAVQKIGGGSSEIETAVLQRVPNRGAASRRGQRRGRGRGVAILEDRVRNNNNIRENSEYEMPPSSPTGLVTYNDELIPQREQDRLNALKRKMKAIEVVKNSRKGRGGKKKRNIRLDKKEAKLSESSSDEEKV